MNCPICNTTINDIKENLFCPVCHWELAALPTNALSLRKEYEKRLAAFQSCYEQSDTIESLSNKIKYTHEKNESIEKELAKLKTEIKEKVNVFGQLEMEQIALQKVQKENCKKQKELKEVEQKIEMERSRLKDLLALNDKVKELEKAYKYAFHRGYGNKLAVIKKFLEDYKNIITER
jgi:chromosome segregation ATPase